MIVFVPLMALWMCVGGGWLPADYMRKRVQAALVMVAMFVLTILPWSWYASRTFGGTVLLDTTDRTQMMGHSMRANMPHGFIHTFTAKNNQIVWLLRVHGDSHRGNILWTPAGEPGEGPHFVDLDDARMGPAVQDLWMLLSGERAVTLKLTNQRPAATPGPVRLAGAVDTVAAAQRHVDQGISCTLFVPSNASTRTLQRYYLYAYAKGLKTLYYTRLRKVSIDECLNCAI